jgi:hypothetical protein
MFSLSVAFYRKLEASADQVWDLITDTLTWPAWGPSVRAVDCRQRYIAAGCSGRIQTSVGIWLPFLITTFESGIIWDWRVAGLLATGHRIDPMGTEDCRLAFTVPAWAFAYGPVCLLALHRIDRLLRSK